MDCLTKCEEMVMYTVWRFPKSPDLLQITEQANRMYEKLWKPQTVSTFLQRLVRKGYLNTHRKGRYTYYIANISITYYRRQVLNNIAISLFDGSFTDMAKEIASINSIKEKGGEYL